MSELERKKKSKINLRLTFDTVTFVNIVEIGSLCNFVVAKRVNVMLDRTHSGPRGTASRDKKIYYRYRRLHQAGFCTLASCSTGNSRDLTYRRSSSALICVETILLSNCLYRILPNVDLSQ